MSTLHSRTTMPRVGEAAPGAGIGLVVLVGDDDGVARLQPAGEGVGEHVGVGGGRGAEMDPVLVDVQRLGDAAIAEVHRLRRLRARPGRSRRAAPCGSRRSWSAFDHLPRGVRAAGVLEEGPALRAWAARRRGTRRGSGRGRGAGRSLREARMAGQFSLAEVPGPGNSAKGEEAPARDRPGLQRSRLRR